MRVEGTMEGCMEGCMERSKERSMEWVSDGSRDIVTDRKCAC